MKFTDKAPIGTEIQAIFIVDKAHEPIRIVSNKMNNENNFNFQLPEHKIHSSIIFSVVDLNQSTQVQVLTNIVVLSSNTGQIFYDGLTGNRATYVTIDLIILL